MPLRARRLRFPAVTATVTIIVLINVAAMLLRDKIPDRPASNLADNPGQYMAAGAVQPVHWRAIGEGALAEARRLDRPIFLLIGSQWSYEARAYDQLVFSRAMVASRLNRDFVPVRIDSSWRHEWASVMLPISTLSIHADPGLQMWVLTPAGELTAIVYDATNPTDIDENAFLAVLDAAYDAWTAAVEVGQRSELAMRNISQTQNLRTMAAHALPQPETYAERVIARIDPTYGGLVWADRQTLEPNDLKLLWLLGEGEALGAAIGAPLHTGAVDWLDGGFYYRSRDRSWMHTAFEKPTNLNAEMVSLLAHVAAESGDQTLDTIARLGFDYLAALAAGRDSVLAYRYDPTRESGRSTRASFAPQDMRKIWVAREREAARDLYGLRVETNPLMLPILGRHDELSDEALRLLADMRRAREDVERVTAEGELLLPTAISAARMLEAARLWEDPVRREQARLMFDRAKSFVVGIDSVQHSKGHGVRIQETLADFAAFSDAALQKFLLDGDDAALRLGAAVLERGVTFFTDDRGILVMTHSLAGTQTLDHGLPELVDPMRESTIARCIRLLRDYGLLLGDESWVVRAGNLAERLAPIANEMGRGVGGYFCSAVRLMDSLAYAVVGLDAVAVANELARRYGRSLVAPATQLAFADLQDAEPGVYVVQSGGTVDPALELPD